MDFTCSPSPKALIFKYKWGSSSNGQAPSVWCYFLTLSSIITKYNGVLSVIYIVLQSFCCWVTNVVPYFLNLS